ncbi:uncharacterized protein LOC142539993 [Primulina tabacum]|uniref:uncharacterized protein LOC142539993 n=1 Tax=Primulina tabacum TaxID=48773 RepID=UPI003F5AC080
MRQLRPGGAASSPSRPSPRNLPPSLHHLRSPPPCTVLLPNLFSSLPANPFERRRHQLLQMLLLLSLPLCLSGIHAPSHPVIDRDAARKLLAAAKIASTSMNKAVVAAKSEAERRTKEAAFARKRAKEALEHVAYLVVKEKLSKKEAALSVSGGLSGSVARGVGVSSLGIDGAKVKSENNKNVILSDRDGNVGVAVDSLVITEKRIVDTKRNIDEIDNSTQVFAALNVVELKENEKISGISAQVELGAPVNHDHVVMDVDEKARTRGVAGENVAELMLEGDNCDIETAIFAHLGGDEEDHDMKGDEQEEVNKGDVLVQSIADQMESMENGNCDQEHDSGTPL